jgi:hypothetical protein
MTVSAIATGSLAVGQVVSGIGVTQYTTITAQLTGTTGSTGTYTVSYSQTVSSTNMSTTVVLTSITSSTASVQIPYVLGYDGGSPVTAVTAKVYLGSSVVNTASGTSSPLTVAGLSNNTVYSATLTATNNVGTSTASTGPYFKTAAVPDAPTIGTATLVGNNGANVAFTVPNNNGNTITSYTITSSPGNLTATGATSPISISSLSYGTTYTFTVYATNSLGNSAVSGASNSITTASITPPVNDPNFANVTLLTNWNSVNAATNNVFIDSSTNNATISQNGTTLTGGQGSYTQFPVSASVGYSTAVNGGSFWLGGNGTTPTAGTTLSIPSNTALAIGTNSFTVEAWINLASTSGDKCIMTLGSGGLGVFVSSGGASMYITQALVAVNNSFTLPATISAGTWYHVAVVRSGTSVQVYLNGVGTASQTNAIVYPQNGSFIGTDANGGSSQFFGYISNLRFTNGVAVYTGNFTVPTAPLAATQSSGTNISAITGTQVALLLNGINGNIYDSAGYNNLFTQGTSVSNLQSIFNFYSIKIPSGTNYLQTPSRTSNQFGTGDFTIEGWIYLSSISSNYTIISKRDTSTGWAVNVTSSNKIQFYYTGGSTLTGATSITANTWIYFAVVRSGSSATNLKIYLNGTVDATSGSAVTDNFNQSTLTTSIGGDPTAGTYFNGYVDQIRLSNIARTITGTPTAPFGTHT